MSRVRISFQPSNLSDDDDDDEDDDEDDDNNEDDDADDEHDILAPMCVTNIISLDKNEILKILF